jgi:exodeoxyribonuclease VII large subunit
VSPGGSQPEGDPILDLFGEVEGEVEGKAGKAGSAGEGNRAPEVARASTPASGPTSRPAPATEARPAPEADPEADEAPAASEPRVWSVSEINQALRALLEDTLPPLWISGEVANWSRARSGHCYFTLKDDRAQLRCVMWRPQAARLPMDPEEGMRVRVHGHVTLYEARGETQFVVRELAAEGEDGLWKLAFERLRKALEADGLLDPARKRPLPRFPATVGVVTSPTGAAFRDILSVIGRRAPWTRVLLRGARVQGEGASVEVARAIRLLAESGEVDVLIVGRGGGSIEDLWAFNEEPVCRAIAASPVPVISAVGHETDVTLSDLVADLRAPTPSAAAEAAVLDGAALLEALARVRPRLARGLRGQVERRRHRVERGEARLRQGIRRVLDPRRRTVERLGERLERGARAGVSARRERLATLAARIEALSPLSTLRRGYAVPRSPEGELLRCAEDFRRSPDFTLRLVDSRISARVTGIEDDDLETTP